MTETQASPHIGTEARPIASLGIRPRAEALSWGLWAIVLLGIAARGAYVYRPFDYRLVNPWRQSDYLQITRNFHREGMNILYPRIDWRGDTPGYAETELPLLPWIGAALYAAFGEHVQLVRAVAAVFEIGSLLLFVSLGRSLLPPTAALVASAAFAFNPLLVILASSLQPEPVMQIFSLLAMALLWRWSQDGGGRMLIAASVAQAMAVLSKLPAISLGFVFAYFVVHRLGRRAFTDPSVYVAAAIATLIPLGWYLWVYRFWVLYGNSLGVSNESHFIGWDLLLPPTPLLGVLRWEILVVFTPAGWLLALAALRSPVSKTVRGLLVWYAAVFAFYVITCRTTGARWADYYHVLSVAPACLLMGAGVNALKHGRAVPERFAWLARRQQLLGGALAVGTLAALVIVAVYRRDAGTDELLPMYTCAVQLAQHVPASERIVVRGGIASDGKGHTIAHNESMMFAWMDRKGFNYANEELSIETLEAIAARGGRYWVAERQALGGSNFEQLVDARFRRVAACENAYYLYDLRSNQP